MRLTNRSERDEAAVLVRELALGDKGGIGLTALATRVNLPTDRVEKLLRRYPDYFVKVGHESGFRLNPFGKFKGSTEQILVDIEPSYNRHKHLQATSAALAVVATLVGVISFLASSS